MWKISAQSSDGERYEVWSRPFDDRTTIESISLGMGLENSAFWLLMDEARAEEGLRFTAIHQWAQQAEEAAKEMDWAGAPRIVAVDRAIARYADHVVSHPACLAWHDQGGVLIRMPDDETELTIEYVPDRSDEQHSARMLFRHADSRHELETIVEWRAFVGSRTGIIDGWSVMRQSGRGYKASLVGDAGFLIARVLRRLTLPEPTLSADPRMQSRLAEQEAANAVLADACPRLEEVEPSRDAETAMVFVHGTASCGIAGLKDLFAPAVAPIDVPCPAFRFEHDTFVPIIDNARTLAAEITRRLRVRRLLLVAHSRGGLVAADAAKSLRDAGYAGEVTVHSFGAPYQGTRLVAMGKKALNLLMKLGEGMADTLPVPMLSPLAKAMFYVMESPTLPPGILAMGEGAEGLAYIRRNADAVRLLSWGSDHDIRTGAFGYGAAIGGFLLGALDRPHDMVVTASSATACGRAQPYLACDHGRYFLQPEVRQAIRAYMGQGTGLPPPEVVQMHVQAAVAPIPQQGNEASIDAQLKTTVSKGARTAGGTIAYKSPREGGGNAVRGAKR